MSSRHVVLLSMRPAIIQRKRRWSSHSYWITVWAMPHRGAAMCHGHVLAATSPHWLKPWPHSASLEGSPSPITSVLPIPSTILPNYSKFYFFPAQLSCPTYWLHWISFSLQVSLSNSNPPLANVMKYLNHVFYLLQKEIMTTIRCQQLKKFRTPSMIWSGHKAKQAQRTNCLFNLNASYSWSGEMSSSYSGDSQGFRHSYLAPVTSFRVWFLAFN